MRLLREVISFAATWIGLYLHPCDPWGTLSPMIRRCFFNLYQVKIADCLSDLFYSHGKQKLCRHNLLLSVA